MRAVTYPAAAAAGWANSLSLSFSPEIHFGAAAQRHFTPAVFYFFFFFLPTATHQKEFHFEFWYSPGLCHSGTVLLFKVTAEFGF